MRLIILAAMLAVTTAASAQSADDLPDQPIARSEVLNVVKRQFAAMDRDRDGFVTEAEFEAYRARDVQTGNSQLAAFDHLGRRWFERADEDGDGRVTLREAQSRPLRLFDMADTDSDGIVSQGERQVALLMMSLGGR